MLECSIAGEIPSGFAGLLRESNSSFSHHPIQSFSLAEGDDIGDDAVEESLPRLEGTPGGVRGDEEIIESGGAGDEEGMIG